MFRFSLLIDIYINQVFEKKIKIILKKKGNLILMIQKTLNNQEIDQLISIADINSEKQSKKMNAKIMPWCPKFKNQKNFS